MIEAQQAAERIREALEKGPTDGPWFVTPRFQDKVDVTHSSLEPGAASMTIARVTVRDSWLTEQMSNAAFIAICSPDNLRALLAERDELVKDAERLDYLDTRNARKNERNGTIYGWWLNENHNRIALEDHDQRKLSAREAIDAARADALTKDN